MSLVRINPNPTRSQLAVFAITWLVFFSGLGWIALSLFQSVPAAIVTWGVAVGVPALAAIVPGLLRMVYLGMAYAGFPIGFVVLHLALAFVYYGIVTPTGLAMRLFGRDPLRRQFDSDAETYWVERKQLPRVDRYFRQF